MNVSPSQPQNGAMSAVQMIGCVSQTNPSSQLP
jgi:hypothetical protein